jgi:hypothetical protein
MKRIALLILLVAVSCASSGHSPNARTPDPLLDLETSLRRVSTLHMRYYVETSGAIQMLGKGSVEWDENHVRIDVSGSIAGKPLSTRYDRPYDRKKDIAESWIRIGLAHNLFRIMNGKEAEGVDAQATNVKVDKGHYTFDMIVEGKRVGTAELWTDASGLPLHREQTVRFPQGEMKVTERYLWLP